MSPPGGAVYGNTGTDQWIGEVCIALWSGGLSGNTLPRHIGFRDRYIGWDGIHGKTNIHLIAYNTRYLLLPWVHFRHLASHLLSCIAGRISADWEKLYPHPLYFLETFVDTERFAGTCYKAANRIYLGLTTGRGKDDQTHKANRSMRRSRL